MDTDIRMIGISLWLLLDLEYRGRQGEGEDRLSVLEGI